VEERKISDNCLQDRAGGWVMTIVRRNRTVGFEGADDQPVIMKDAPSAAADGSGWWRNASAVELRLPPATGELGRYSLDDAVKEAMVEISLPAGIAGIGEGALQGCAALTKLAIPASVVSLGAPV
jgi:hypothetical protein